MLLTASRELLLVHLSTTFRFRDFPTDEAWISTADGYPEEGQGQENNSESALIVRTLKSANALDMPYLMHVALERLQVLTERCPAERVDALFEAGDREQLWDDLMGVCLGDIKKAELAQGKAKKTMTLQKKTGPVPSFSKGLLDSLTSSVKKLNGSSSPWVGARHDSFWGRVGTFWPGLLFAREEQKAGFKYEDAFGGMQMYISALRVVGALFHAARVHGEDRFGLTVQRLNGAKRERYHVARVLELLLECHMELSKLVAMRFHAPAHLRSEKHARERASTILHELHSTIFRVVAAYRDDLRPFRGREYGEEGIYSAEIILKAKYGAALKNFLEYCV